MGGGNPDSVVGFALKADVKHYFDTVDHAVLLSIFCKRLRDEDVLWLVDVILANHKTQEAGKGMPLGNLTSQFFANVYLSELDYFVKHELKVKYYLRYVDDFIILERNKALLQDYKFRINEFLKNELKLELHPEKSRIIALRRGVTLLGFRVFYHFRLLKKTNLRRVWKRLLVFEKKLAKKEITKEKIMLSMAGWEGYAKMGNTFKLRQEIRGKVRKLLATV